MKKIFEQPVVTLEILWTQEDIMTEDGPSTLWGFEEHDFS